MRLDLHFSLCLLALLPAAFCAAQSVELEQIDISSTGDSEQADGPVEGYRATRSASATRTDTPIENVPQSISVVPRQVLEDLGDSRIDRPLDFAGGVGRQNDFGGTSNASLSVRGFTSGWSTGALFRNGFSVNRGYFAIDAASLERVEVLKGPAGGLFGRGDPGGVVNLVSKRPQKDAFNQLKLTAGQWDRYRADLDVNAPLTEDGSLLGRTNISIESRKSFRDYADTERQLIAPALTWHISDNTRLLLDSEFVRTDSVMDRGIPAVNGKMGSVKKSTFLGEPDDGQIRVQSSLMQLALEHDLNEDWTLRLSGQYLESWLRGDVTESTSLTGSTLNREYNPNNMNTHSLMLHAEALGRFELGGMQHQLLAGLETENWRQDNWYGFSDPGTDPYPIDIYDPIYGTPKPPVTILRAPGNHVQSYALNLQDQIELTDRLSALTGLRLERYKQQQLNRLTGDKSAQEQDVAVPRFGLSYKVNPDVTVFGSVGTSFTPNGVSSLGTRFEPEKGIGYESGVKLNLLDDRLSATLAAFYIHKKNVLNAHPSIPGEQITVGEVRSQGFDAQLAGKISDTVSVIAAYAFIDAKVTKDTRPGYQGSRLAGIPRHSGSLLSVWEFLPGKSVGATLNHVGQRPFATGGTAPKGEGLASYTTVDMLAKWELSPKTSLGLNLNNAFNKTYYERSWQDLWVMPGEPRNLNLSWTLNF